MSYSGGVGPEATPMAAPVAGTKILLCKSGVKDKKPDPAGADYGEVFVNYHSGSPMLCFKDNAGEIVEIKPTRNIDGGGGETPPSTGNEIGDSLWDGTHFRVWDGSTWVAIGPNDLAYVQKVDGGTITNSAGSDVDIPVVNNIQAGLMLPGDKNKLDTYPADAADLEVDLGYTAAADKGTVTNTNGDDAEIPLATGTNAGLMAPGDKNKIDGYPASPDDISGTLDLQAVTDNGNTTTNGATFGGDVDTSGFFRSDRAAGNASLITRVDGTTKTMLLAEGDLRLGGTPTNSATTNIRLKGEDGSASFAGAVETSYLNVTASSAQSSGNLVRINGASSNVITFGYDGGASFAGNVTSTDGSNYSSLRPGYIVINASPDFGQVFGAYTGSSYSSSINADGSASFAGGNISLNADGSAYMKGGLNVSSDSSTVPSAAGQQGGFYAASNAGGVEICVAGQSALNMNRLSSDGEIQTFYRGNNKVGSIEVGSDDFIINGKGQSDQFVLKADGSASFATGNISLNANGSAHFKGNVTSDGTIGFNLEPDNEANYEVTTEAYEAQEEITPYIPAVPATYDEEGNELTAAVTAVDATYQTVTKTREIRIYNGPTLDVKEALLSLQQKVNDRDAVIASLTTRIAALEAQAA